MMWKVSSFFVFRHTKNVKKTNCQNFSFFVQKNENSKNGFLIYTFFWYRKKPIFFGLFFSFFALKKVMNRCYFSNKRCEIFDAKIIVCFYLPHILRNNPANLRFVFYAGGVKSVGLSDYPPSALYTFCFLDSKKVFFCVSFFIPNCFLRTRRPSE